MNQMEPMWQWDLQPDVLVGHIPSRSLLDRPPFTPSVTELVCHHVWVFHSRELSCLALSVRLGCIWGCIEKKGPEHGWEGSLEQPYHFSRAISFLRRISFTNSRPNNLWFSLPTLIDTSRREWLSCNLKAINSSLTKWVGVTPWARNWSISSRLASLGSGWLGLHVWQLLCHHCCKIPSSSLCAYPIALPPNPMGEFPLSLSAPCLYSLLAEKRHRSMLAMPLQFLCSAAPISCWLSH